MNSSFTWDSTPISSSQSNSFVTNWLNGLWHWMSLVNAWNYAIFKYSLPFERFNGANTANMSLPVYKSPPILRKRAFHFPFIKSINWLLMSYRVYAKLLSHLIMGQQKKKAHYFLTMHGKTHRHSRGLYQCFIDCLWLFGLRYQISHLKRFLQRISSNFGSLLVFHNIIPSAFGKKKKE